MVRCAMDCFSSEDAAFAAGDWRKITIGPAERDRLRAFARAHFPNDPLLVPPEMTPIVISGRDFYGPPPKVDG